MKYSLVVKKDTFWLVIIFILIGLQNNVFDTRAAVGGMDMVSLGLSISLLMLAARLLMLGRVRLSRALALLILYLVFLVLWGVASANSLFRIFVDARPLLFLFSGYIVFQGLRVNEHTFEMALNLSGLICSVFYLVTYEQQSALFGIGYRNVSFPLVFTLSAISITLLSQNIESQSAISRIFDWTVVFLGSTAIVISQQRTLVIPLVLCFVIFILKNFKFNLRNIGRVLLLTLCAFAVYSVFQKIGVISILRNRFRVSSFFAQDSTLIVRGNTTSSTFQNLSFLSWTIGTPFGSAADLEMWIPNLVAKYGIVGTLVVFAAVGGKALRHVLTCLRSNFTELNSYFFSFVVISIGGFISGFGGNIGQLYIAMSMAMIVKSSDRYTEHL
ncbi:hypothetical protein [Lacticaseibacillus kribbianus]|uniref:hypothetical protein n=1 Tax=Lacticaseibacillus kribbianus TaxID=2926292 RepID=UPI001CD1C973|nr:hypothetical protein [Lacticaseibacillus kribbianus]